MCVCGLVGLAQLRASRSRIMDTSEILSRGANRLEACFDNRRTDGEWSSLEALDTFVWSLASTKERPDEVPSNHRRARPRSLVRDTDKCGVLCQYWICLRCTCEAEMLLFWHPEGRQQKAAFYVMCVKSTANNRESSTGRKAQQPHVVRKTTSTTWAQDFAPGRSARRIRHDREVPTTVRTQEPSAAEMATSASGARSHVEESTTRTRARHAPLPSPPPGRGHGTLARSRAPRWWNPVQGGNGQLVAQELWPGTGASPWGARWNE